MTETSSIDVSTAKGVEKALRTPVLKVKIYTVGGGLYLRVRPDGSASWVFASARGGRRREMGLGSASKVTLGKAREAAIAHAAALTAGRDPFEERVASKTELPAPAGAQTFGEFADAMLLDLLPGFKSEVHKKQWRATLATYAKSLWVIPIDEVTTKHVVDVLRPIWLEKPETATRLRGRIERILDAAAVSGHRDPDRKNPAAWKGHLSLILARPRKKRDQKHHAAIRWQDMPAFWDRLTRYDSVSADALQFTILTAARTGEVLGARISEFDLEARKWVVPRERMKAGARHEVALSNTAIAIVKKMARDAHPTEYLFPGGKPRRGLSQMAMLQKLRDMQPGVTVHGFRSTFRDWCGDATDYPRDLAEMALAHTVGNAVEAAYRRGRAFARRLPMMEDWARYLATGAVSDPRPESED